MRRESGEWIPASFANGRNRTAGLYIASSGYVGSVSRPEGTAATMNDDDIDRLIRAFKEAEDHAANYPGTLANDRVRKTRIALRKAGIDPTETQNRAMFLTPWFAVGYPDEEGFPIPSKNKRHLDRHCTAIVDAHDRDVRQLRQDEIEKHAPCLWCAG